MKFLIGAAVAASLLYPTVAVTNAPTEADLSSAKQLYCLSEAIYFEAGNQPFVGKLAVAGVIINRVKSDKYPNSICAVVHQGPTRESWKKDGTHYPVRHKCQFSYYCDGKHDKPVMETITWQNSVSAAGFVYYNNVLIVDGATHYHATYVSPAWAKQLRRVTRIEDHIFYK
mgnify:CR=1 FL=1